MKFSQVIVLALAAFAASATASNVQMEPSIATFGGPNWVRGPRVSSGEEIEVTFVVKTCPMRRAALEEKFWSVSTPSSRDYKKFMSVEEVAEFLHPVPTDGEQLSAQAVIEHLKSTTGLLRSEPHMDRTRDLVTVRMDAQKAESFFQTELYSFKHKKSPVMLIRAGAPYFLPEELAQHVSFVEKLVRLPYVRQPKVLSDGSLRSVSDADDEFNSCDVATCKEATTPDVLKTRYQLPTLDSAQPSNGMACAEFQFQGLDDEDLSNFATTCGVDHVEVDKTIGAGGSVMPGVEALLDIEYIEAVAAPINLTVINSISFSLYDWMSSVNNDPDAAYVQSVSYGNDEIQQESTEYMYDCNTQFMKAGTRGISVLFASGDQGVWGRSGHTGNVFHPDFPGASPYITTVGGTDFAEKSTMGDETTWVDGGGGFSNTFGIPDYQADAVQGYFDSGVDLPDSSYYNATGRGYPDVAALAGQQNGYCVAARGSYLKVGGTSAACPVFAGVVAMINDELIAAGKPQMGFLNPWIYSVAAPGNGFFDVTTGTNNANIGAGFTATSGWDPATGFGTPNYPVLLELATSA